MGELTHDAETQPDRGFWADPPWWFREIVLAVVIGLALLGTAWLLEGQRMERAERLENLRFVRERSSFSAMERPFGGMDLRGQNLNGLHLSGADIRDADLRDANLGVTDLRDAVLNEANLGGAELSFANLTGASLSGADLDGAILLGTNLRGTLPRCRGLRRCGVPRRRPTR